MSNTEPIEIGMRVTAALDFATSGGSDDVRDHLLWVVGQITNVVGLDDLTTPELAGLTALLIPPHARLLAGNLPADDAATRKWPLRLVDDDAV